MLTDNPAEKALLGAALRGDASAAIEAGAALTPEHFAHDAHREIWRAILALDKAGITPEPVTVAAALRKVAEDSDYLGPVYLIELLEHAPVAQNLDYFASAIAASAWRRKAVDAIGSLQRHLSTQDGASLAIDQAMVSDTFTRILDDAVGQTTTQPMRDITRELIDDLEARIVNYRDGKSRGVTTGINMLDRVIGGWVATRFYVVGARTGFGKTTLSVNFASAAADASAPWVYFTNEMSGKDIAEKILSLRARLRSDRLQSGALSDDELDRAVAGLQNMSTMQGYADNYAGRSIEGFEAATRRAVKRHGVKVVFLDYVQQMHVKSERFKSRHEELTCVTNRIKQLARSLNIAIVACAQLSRESDKADHPTRNHLKDSGSIEQDADAIILIHRDDVKDTTHLLIDKNRWGREGRVAVDVDLGLNRFVESTNIRQEEYPR